MYNNSYNRGGGGYRERSYSYDHGDGYGRSERGYSGRSRNNGGQRRKHSGCKFGISPKNNKPYIQGWNYSRRNGMLKFIASPANDDVTKSDNSKKWVVKVSAKGQRPYLVTGFYHPATRKMTVPDLQMVANPNAPNGGYFGRFYRTRNSR